MSERPSEAKYRGVVLGAALGDALGWPHENRARNASGAPRGSLGFSDWVKRSGGRFQAHEERIPAGSYSDDTQLIVAVARSLSQDRRWWDYFSRVELPFWTTYERGGGGATIRAAKSWLKNIPPWKGATTEAQKYFAAGGNGAAMRIAPHVLAGAAGKFEIVARDILIDSVITHGHPQGIVGALSYGYALWLALRNRETLEYGQLIDEVLVHQGAWAQWRDIEDIWPDWLSIARNHGFESNWATAVETQARQLRVAQTSLRAGALSVDQETLEAIGCFDKKILGAGTVAASASIFLASRYAAAPMEGVAAAAFSKGADTDTIASMTGALAGAISGVDWLGSLVREVQDYAFLLAISSKLQNVDPPASPIVPVGEKFISKFFRDLGEQASVDVPSGMPSTFQPADYVRSKIDNIRARSWLATSSNTQTLVFKKLDRLQPQADRGGRQETLKLDTVDDRSNQAVFAGIELFAGDLTTSTHFYRDLLGLPVTRQTSKLIRLGSHLVLRQSESNVVAGTGTKVYIQVNNVLNCIRKINEPHSSDPDVERVGNRLSFVCNDPDGRTVEIFQHDSG